MQSPGILDVQLPLEVRKIAVKDQADAGNGRLTNSTWTSGSYVIPHHSGSMVANLAHGDGSVSSLRGIGLFNQNETMSFVDWYAAGGPLKCYNKDGNVWTYDGKARTSGNTRGS